MKGPLRLIAAMLLNSLGIAQVAFSQSLPAAPPFNLFEKKTAGWFDSGSHFQPTATTGAISATSNNTPTAARAAYAKLPLSFVSNAGQMNARVRYSAQSGSRNFYFTPPEAVFSFAGKNNGLVLRLSFLNGNKETPITGQMPESGKVHYLIGKDPAKWHTNLPTYGEVVYHDLWPGIDLLFRGEGGQLSYEFLVRPGARVQDIRLAYRGAQRLSLDPNGNLMIHTSLGSITDTRPVTYQLIDGQRVPVTSRFVLYRRGTSKTAYGFAVGDYDRSRELVLDPGLVYSTYLGGTADDVGNGIAVDSAGQAYVTGNTYSDPFPTTAGAFDRKYNGSGGFAFGGGDVFVTKLNSTGSALIYSTYLGGSGDEPVFGASIAIDAAGNAYVAGTTDSADFPTTLNAFQQSLKGIEDAFVTKLNQDGSGLVYSTYLGGGKGGDPCCPGQDGAYLYTGIAVDSSGYAYVTGFTDSTDFPTTPGALQMSNKGGFYDAFVTKLNKTGTGLMYSTYLGGSGDDDATGIAVDAAGNAYVVGYTSSTDFPIQNAVQPMQGGPPGSYDAFVVKLNSTGTGLVYSTFLGGSLDDFGASIALDSCGNVYLTGQTLSPDFPFTPNAPQKIPGGGVDAFVAKLNASGSAIVYSTYLGGAADDGANSIAVDTAGQAYITGFTSSPNFPVTADALQGLKGQSDAFVTKLNPAGTALVYSTYLGGTVDDAGNGIALSRSRKVYISGSSDSPDFPTTQGAYNRNYNSGVFYGDAFVTKLDVPRGEVGDDKADGDGEAVEQNSGRESKFHFHKKSSCPDQNDSENDNVQADDDGSGPHFQSTSVTSATYTVVDTSQTVTMVGAGVHNGLPVSFTMVAVNYGDVAPGVFQITLTDGYSFIGSIVAGALDIW